MKNVKNMFKINDVSGQNSECCAYASRFLPYAHKKLGFNKPVGVNFVSDPQNAKDPLGKTAYYDPNKMEITVFVDKRHVKDILRSLSHELVHHTQNCRGEFDHGIETGDGYAQKDPHMRKMEAEAYLLGNGFIFRDWEDKIKQMNENRNLKEEIVPHHKFNAFVRWLVKLMTDRNEEYKRDKAEEEAKKRKINKKKDIDKAIKLAREKSRESLKEKKQMSNFNEVKLRKYVNNLVRTVLSESRDPKEEDPGGTGPSGPTDPTPPTGPGDEEGEVEGAINESEPGSEATNVTFKKGPCKGMTAKEAMTAQCKPGPEDHLDDEGGPTNENWLKSNKDQLLFEELVKKWTK